jgi:hypothetical protein
VENPATLHENGLVMGDADRLHAGQAVWFGDYEQSMAKKRSRRERFLSEMEAVVPWKALIDLIEPHYPGPPEKDQTACTAVDLSSFRR